MKMIEDSFVRFCVWINGPLINTVTLHLRLWNKADCVNHCFCENCHGGVRFKDLFRNSIKVVLDATGSSRAICARACGCRAVPGTGFERSHATAVARERSAATDSTSSAQWLLARS